MFCRFPAAPDILLEEFSWVLHRLIAQVPITCDNTTSGLFSFAPPPPSSLKSSPPQIKNLQAKTDQNNSLIKF